MRAPALEEGDLVVAARARLGPLGDEPRGGAGEKGEQRDREAASVEVDELGRAIRASRVFEDPHT